MSRILCSLLGRKIRIDRSLCPLHTISNHLQAGSSARIMFRDREREPINNHEELSLHPLSFDMPSLSGTRELSILIPVIREGWSRIANDWQSRKLSSFFHKQMTMNSWTYLHHNRCSSTICHTYNFKTYSTIHTITCVLVSVVDYISVVKRHDGILYELLRIIKTFTRNYRLTAVTARPASFWLPQSRVSERW